MKTKITPHRYVIHVSHPYFRESIDRKGLLKNGTEGIIPEGVYAHNLLVKPNYDWFPFVLKFECDSFLSSITNEGPLRLYDYWVIDTHAIDNDWYIDYCALSDFGDDTCYNTFSMFIYSDKDVPRSAIKLFRFQNEMRWDYKGVDGAYHFRGLDEFREYIE